MSGLGSMVLGVGLSVAVNAHADPSKAIPDNGSAPAYLQPGRSFSGLVVRLLDGYSLCVAVGDGPASWVEVRLVDFYAPASREPGGPAAKAALERIALGKVVRCTTGPQSYDRVVSASTISGRPIGEMMRAAGVAQGGRGYEHAHGHPPRRVAEIEPEPAQESGLRHRSCREARAVGAAPMYRGQPDYNPALDGNGDGIACELYRGGDRVGCCPIQ
jgi:hypothetical protein